MPRMILVLCLIVVAAIAPTIVRAEPEPLLPGRLADPVQIAPRGLSQQMRPREPLMTPSEAARRVQRSHGGRVLSVQTDGLGYRVKVLKDGEVRIFRVQP